MSPAPFARLAVLAASTIAVLAACTRAGRGARPSGGPSASACCLTAGLEIAERHRVGAIASRRFTHGELWSALDPIVRAPALRSRPIGESLHGRAIRAVEYGSGPTTVLLWSQMHGDESTATMALADVLAWLASPSPAHESIRRRIGERLTVTMVPMLNPDGAELFQRENAIGVDVNRDARRLATPEARALKTLRDSLRPMFGFNLHDQGARTLAGRGGQQVAIALLAPAADERLGYGPIRSEARLVAAEIATVLAGEIPGRIAKYEDDFNPRAFGDLMQQWGTRTVLIESGALPDDPEKQRLRALNVVAIVSALDAIATGRHRDADPRAYDRLPMNDRAVADVLVRGGMLVLPGAEPVRADLALNYEDPVGRARPRVREVGDLSAVAALDTIDATGLFVHPSAAALTEERGARWLRVGAPAALTIRRGASPASEAVRAIGDGRR